MKILISLMVVALATVTSAQELDEFPESVFEVEQTLRSREYSLQSALKGNAHLWEDGVLPLVFAETIDAQKQALLFKACEEWGRAAHITCVNGPYKNRQLRVTDNLGKGCWASWGMGSHYLIVARRMNLAPNCWSHRTLLHELGHSLGFIHEHQRPDRDQYVMIHPENIEPVFLRLNIKVNFGIQDSVMIAPYDFLSIMHYGRRAHSKNGFDTITPNPQYAHYASVIGHATSLSDGDKKAAQALYGQP